MLLTVPHLMVVILQLRQNTLHIVVICKAGSHVLPLYFLCTAKYCQCTAKSAKSAKYCQVLPVYCKVLPVYAGY